MCCIIFQTLQTCRSVSIFQKNELKVLAYFAKLTRKRFDQEAHVGRLNLVTKGVPDDLPNKPKKGALPIA